MHRQDSTDIEPEHELIADPRRGGESAAHHVARATQPQATGAAFEPVSGAEPVPPGYARFRIGERFPWKGLIFEVRSMEGALMVLEVVDVTKKNRPKGKRGKRPLHVSPAMERTAQELADRIVDSGLLEREPGSSEDLDDPQRIARSSEDHIAEVLP
jgi:hypothetical protein